MLQYIHHKETRYACFTKQVHDHNGSVYRDAGLLILNYIVLLLGPISALHDELQYTRASIDRVETKVDEVRGYLKLIADDTTEDIPPASIK